MSHGAHRGPVHRFGPEDKLGAVIRIATFTIVTTAVILAIIMIA